MLNQEIAYKARSWVGTNFRHLGRTRSEGCDCLGLFMGVASELGLRDKFGNPVINLDETSYSLVPDGVYMHSKLSNHFIEKEIANIAPGDLVLLKFANNPQHLAIVGSNYYDGSQKFTLIHTYFSLGKVCEHILDKKWQERVAAVYSIQTITK